MNFVDEVVYQEGVTLMDQKDTQTILKGSYFSGFGPEMFVEFMRTSAELYDNHCVILKRLNRFGNEKKITLMGTYEEWLTYFAEYKRDLDKFTRYNRKVEATNKKIEHNLDAYPGCITMGLYSIEYFQMGNSIEDVALKGPRDDRPLE